MAKTAKNIPTLNHEEAMDFFMKSEQHHRFELLKYFTFDEVLKYVRLKIGATPFIKLCSLPNSDYNQLWFKNMTYTQDKKKGTSPYSLRLCQLVVGKEIQAFWNNCWVTSDITKNLPYDYIVNKKTLKKVIPVIMFRETRVYNEQSIS